MQACLALDCGRFRYLNHLFSYLHIAVPSLTDPSLVGLRSTLKASPHPSRHDWRFVHKLYQPATWSERSKFLNLVLRDVKGAA
jgi:hypothetical protein